MAKQWRRWLPGTKHGVARGVAVFGSPGYARDADVLKAHLELCPALRSWAQGCGLELSGVSQDLALLDDEIGEQDHDALTALASDAGLFLGTVIISNAAGARWLVWPNGHPVVLLASGRELDVVAIANRRFSTGVHRLADLYADAIADRPF
jgi:Family of unknown function (DUF6278)